MMLDLLYIAMAVLVARFLIGIGINGIVELTFSRKSEWPVWLFSMFLWGLTVLGISSAFPNSLLVFVISASWAWFSNYTLRTTNAATIIVRVLKAGTTDSKAVGNSVVNVMDNTCEKYRSGVWWFALGCTVGWILFYGQMNFLFQ